MELDGDCAWLSPIGLLTFQTGFRMKHVILLKATITKKGIGSLRSYSTWKKTCMNIAGMFLQVGSRCHMMSYPTRHNSHERSTTSKRTWISLTCRERHDDSFVASCAFFKMLKQSPKHRVYLAHPHTPSTQDSGKSHWFMMFQDASMLQRHLSPWHFVCPYTRRLRTQRWHNNCWSGTGLRPHAHSKK